MKKIFLFLICIWSISASAQLSGGSGNGLTPGAEVKASEINSGGISGDVNVFSGTYSSSYNLGSVSSLGGTSFSLNLNYNSSFVSGGNPPLSTGMPYGEGWSLALPMISVSTENYNKYTLNEMRRIGENHPAYDETQFYYDEGTNSCEEADEEGRVFWFSPSLNIPGVASGRMVYKEKDGSDYLFVLHHFERYIEARFNGNSTWEVIVDDGTRYVFEATVISHRNASNQRVEKECTDDDDDNSVGNLVLPKSEILSWYCDRIYHPNNSNSIINFEYGKYGAFNFFEKYQDPYVHHYSRTRIMTPPNSSKPALGSENITYKDIILESVSSNTEELVLNYENILTTYIDPSTGANLLVPGIDGAEAVDGDPMYTKKVVQKFGNDPCGEELTKWDRFFHAKSSEVETDYCDPIHGLNSTNPYQALRNVPGSPESQWYIKESAEEDNAGGTIPFKHSYLQSPRIAASTRYDDKPAGDIYQLKTTIHNKFSESTDRSLMLDINLATGHNEGVWLEEINAGNDKTLVGAGCYNRTTQETVFSTFNQAVKWFSDPQELLYTSNYFVMPNLPIQYNGFHIQIGPSNGDMDFAKNLCFNSGSVPPLVCEAYYNRIHSANPTTPSHNNSDIMESGASTPSNFGVGIPWYMLSRDYNYSMEFCTDDNVNPPPFWWRDVDGPFCTNSCTWENYPTRAIYESNTDGIFLNEVELIRYAKNPYMLSLVTKRVLNESGNWVPVNSVGLKYEIQKTPRYVTSESGPESNPVHTTYLKDNRNIFLLKKIRQLPAGATDFDASLAAPTTEFGYNIDGYWESIGNGCDPWLGCEGSNFFNSDFPLLEVVVDPLGKICQLEYLPVSQNYIDINTEKSSVFPKINPGLRYNTDYSSPGSLCQVWDSERIPDPAHSLQVNFIVKERIVSDKDVDKIWSYEYDTRVFYDDSAPFNPQFAWDMQSDMQIGHNQTTVYGPSASAGSGPRTVYHFYSSGDGLFGKINGITNYDESNSQISGQSFTYESQLAFEAPWATMNQSNIQHPDMVAFDDMFELPLFYETRYADQFSSQDLNSYFIKKTSEVSSIYDNGGFMSTNTDYEYYDADSDLNSTSSGLAIMGVPSSLNEQPSWQLYKKHTNYGSVGAYTEEEYFYLYDLVNHPNHQASSGLVANLRNTLKMRNIPFEVRVTTKGPDDAPITRSSYSNYSLNWGANSGSMYLKSSATQVEEGNGDILGFSGLDLNPVYPYEALVASTINTRNDFGQPTSQTDHKDLTSSAIYNSITGLIESYTNGVGEEYPLATSYEYFDNNTVSRVTDPNGIILDYTYDGYLRLLETRRNDVLIQEVAYSNWPNIHNMSFTERAQSNFVSSTTHVDQSQSWSEVSFVDPLGRKAADVKDGVLLFNPIYDIHNRAVLTLKPMGGGGPNHNFNFPNQDHAEAVFDTAPRNRAKKTSKFGESISGNHTVDTDYGIVSIAIVNQALSPTGNNTLPSGGFFHKTLTTDEDGKEVLQFTNQLGQVAATVTNNGTIGTVLKYDSHGNVKEIHNPKNQLSTYEYNYLGQLFKEDTPDGGLKFYGYNPSGQLVADRHLNKQNRAMNYDVFGRLIIQVGTKLPNFLTSNEGMAWVGNPNFEQGLTGVINSGKLQKQWFYNEYDDGQSGDYEANAIDYLNNSLTNTIGQLVQTSSYDKKGSIIEHTFVSYTDDGFTKWEMMQLKKPEDRLVRIDYHDHNLLGSPYKQNIDLNGDASLDFQYRYLYDNWNRIIEVYANYDDPDADDGNLIVDYEYNNVKGVVDQRRYYDSSNPGADGTIPAACKNMKVDHTTFSYDERIRLRTISSDLFGYRLYYDDEVNSGHSTGSTLNYNGNINGIQAAYKLNSFENANDATIMEGPTNYNYTYDNLNRLTQAEAFVDNTSQNIPNVAEWGDVNFDYDKIGNLLNLTRGVRVFQAIQNNTYTYNYPSGNNRLSSVMESFGTTRIIGYDGNGNMTTDSKKDLTAAYGRANLPWSVSTTIDGVERSSNYLYNANDSRIIKSVKGQEGTSTEYYIRTLGGQDIAVYHFEDNAMTWYVHGNERVAKIDQNTPVDFTLTGGDTPKTCDPNPPTCDPQMYNQQIWALPQLRAYMANRDGNQMSFPQDLYRIRLCDGTEMNILDDELSMLPGNYTTLQETIIYNLSQSIVLEGNGHRINTTFGGYLLGRGYDERVYVDGYQPCVVRSTCTEEEIHVAISTSDTDIFTDYYNSNTPYGDLTILSPGSEASLEEDGLNWTVNHNGYPAEAEWDISLSLPDNAEITDFYLEVITPNSNTVENMCRLLFFDGEDIATVNGGQELTYLQGSQSYIITPDELPELANLQNLKLAIYYGGPTNFFVDIDVVKVHITYDAPCACIAPPPICPGNSPIEQVNTLTDLRNHIQQTSIADIAFPTKIYRTRYCDGSEINVIRSEMSIPKGGGLTVQRIGISNANQLLDVRLANGTDVVISFGDLIDLRKTEEGVRIRNFCTTDDDNGDPYDDPLDENEPEPLDMSFYLYDHLGNSRILFSTDFDCGEDVKYYIENAIDYFPYGKVLRDFNRDDTEKYLTTYHERDEATDLDYRGARFYDSDLGKFLSLDPLALEFPEWSDYNYVLGNPMAFVDPDGKEPEPPKNTWRIITAYTYNGNQSHTLTSVKLFTSHTGTTKSGTKEYTTKAEFLEVNIQVKNYSDGKGSIGKVMDITSIYSGEVSFKGTENDDDFPLGTFIEGSNKTEEVEPLYENLYHSSLIDEVAVLHNFLMEGGNGNRFGANGAYMIRDRSLGEKAAIIGGTTLLTNQIGGFLSKTPYGAAVSGVVGLVLGVANVTYDSFKKPEDAIGKTEILQDTSHDL